MAVAVDLLQSRAAGRCIAGARNGQSVHVTILRRVPVSVLRRVPVPARTTLGAVVAVIVAAVCAGPAAAAGPRPTTTKRATAIGAGGAVASDTLPSTRAGLEVLRSGGTAADAAVAVAATLGVSDPYVAGIGGGGYFVYYDARTRTVYTIDGRETAPSAATPSLFIDPSHRQAPAVRDRRHQRPVGGGSGNADDLAAGPRQMGQARACL